MRIRYRHLSSFFYRIFAVKDVLVKASMTPFRIDSVCKRSLYGSILLVFINFMCILGSPWQSPSKISELFKKHSPTIVVVVLGNTSGSPCFKQISPNVVTASSVRPLKNWLKQNYKLFKIWYKLRYYAQVQHRSIVSKKPLHLNSQQKLKHIHIPNERRYCVGN